MASKKAKKQDVEDIAQWNHRKPGEPNNNTMWNEHGTHPITKEEAGLSPMAGNSEPKTPEEIDLENTWSTAR